jgi:collagen type VII alpha
MRRRLSYANVTATLALVFAMSGGAMAANHYLITSTKQINPKVLKKLTGKAGSTGATGATGPQGATGKEGAAGKEGLTGKEGKEGLTGKEGKEGKQGEVGSFETALASGKTETGDWGAGFTAAGSGNAYFATGTFPIPLPAGLNSEHVLYVSGSSATHCSGAGHAEAGYLCVYGGDSINANTPSNSNIFNGEAAGPPGIGTHGFTIRLSSTSSGETLLTGSYAVTAP